MIQEAVQREVKEETGLEFKPQALIHIEGYEKMSWIRFTFSGMCIVMDVCMYVNEYLCIVLV